MWAIVTWRAEFVHRYPAAKGQVEFLQHPHRHMLHCEAWIEQFHDDRDIEYISAKAELCCWLEDRIGDFQLDAGDADVPHVSCEMVAKEVIEFLRECYGCHRRYRVKVMEDGENGTMVEREAGLA